MDRIDAFSLYKELYSQNNKILTSSKNLNKLLKGGIKLHQITEIYGAKGIGKTAFCCQLCLNIQLPKIHKGMDAESFYISTEANFSYERLKEMAEATAKEYSSTENAHYVISRESLMEGINVIFCEDYEQMYGIIKDLNKFIRVNKKIKLIIIDSLAFPFYFVKGDKAGNERLKILYCLTHILYKLINEFKLAVVITNNLTTRKIEGGLDLETPYLGEQWTYIPNKIVEFYKHDNERKAFVKKNPHSNTTNEAVSFRVVENGIRD